MNVTVPRINSLKSTLCVPWNQNLDKYRNWFLGICIKNVLVQFRKWYLILQLRKCQKHECRRYPRFTPLCAWKFEFQKCRNRFLGTFMKNVVVQFRRYFISRSRKSKKHECQRYPVFTLEDQIFLKILSQHIYTHPYGHILKISCL